WRRRSAWLQRLAALRAEFSAWRGAGAAFATEGSRGGHGDRGAAAGAEALALGGGPATRALRRHFLAALAHADVLFEERIVLHLGFDELRADARFDFFG